MNVHDVAVMGQGCGVHDGSYQMVATRSEAASISSGGHHRCDERVRLRGDQKPVVHLRNLGKPVQPVQLCSGVTRTVLSRSPSPAPPAMPKVSRDCPAWPTGSWPRPLAHAGDHQHVALPVSANWKTAMAAMLRRSGDWK